MAFGGARWEDIISKWLVFEKGEQAYKAVLTDDKFDESLNLSLSSGMWLVSAHGVNEGQANRHYAMQDYTYSRQAV